METDSPFGQWLRLFADETRDAVLREHDRDTCVLTSRFGFQVLRYFGVPAMPEAVAVSAFTPDRFAQFMSGVQEPTVGYAVGIAGTGRLSHRPSGASIWDGHLVLRLTTRPQIVDLSADQMDRPHHGLRVPGPVISPVFDLDQWHRDRHLTLAISTGAVVIYEAISDTTWRSTGDWVRRDAASRHVIGSIIRALPPPPAQHSPTATPTSPTSRPRDLTGAW